MFYKVTSTLDQMSVRLHSGGNGHICINQATENWLLLRGSSSDVLSMQYHECPLQGDLVPCAPESRQRFSLTQGGVVGYIV